MTGRGVAPYSDSGEHIKDCLDWLDRALRLMLHGLHQREIDDAAQGHRWFMSPEQAEHLLAQVRSVDDAMDLAASVREARQRINARVTASAEQGRYLALPHLVQMFRLSAVEEVAIVACLAAELDGRYSRLYGYLHDDLTRRCPTLDLISRLYAIDAGEGSTPAVLCSTNANVFRWALVHAVGRGDAGAPRLTRELVIDGRIAAFLLGMPDVDEHIAPFVSRYDPMSESAASDLDGELVDGLRRVLLAEGSRPVVYLHGPAASGGRLLAAAVCRPAKLRLLRVEIDEMFQSSSAPGALALSDMLRRAFREALLSSAAVYFCGVDRLDDARASACLRILERMVAEAPALTFIEARRFLWGLPDSEWPAVLPVQLGYPDYSARRREWRRLAESTSAAQATDRELETLATRYRLTISEIADAYRLAGLRAAMRADGAACVGIDDLHWAARTRAHAYFGSLARMVVPRAGWDDLVLSAATARQLRDICEQVRHRATVLHQWGFDRRLSRGKGLYVLFVGASGTGKTLAAEVIAGTLGVDLLAVDLSGVVSKYIGETEKNLERIFAGAERSDAILFFDEADALFGKRSEVRDAHDRYANIETNYLLQRLEQFEGVVILATNLAQNLDDAFSRRIHVSVEFPFPDEAARGAIWRRHVPEETPVAADLDFGLLAKRYKIAGGNIRNIALNAAYLAAAAGGRLQMTHLHQATQREYEKIGKFWEDWPAGAASA